MRKVLMLQIFLAVLLMLGAASAHAATYTVGAYANSTSGGSGAPTITLIGGQQFTVTADPNDLWSAGPLPRWSNADGLIGDLYATGSDDSGQSAGTHIGQLFSNYTQGGLTAPYGSLVGQIGSGDFFFVGTNYTGAASAAGTLNLYYFDSNNGDNSGSIIANVNAASVPEPGAILLLVPGLVGLVSVRRRFKK